MWDTVLPRTFVRAASTPQTAFLSVSLIPLVLFSNVSEGFFGLLVEVKERERERSYLRRKGIEDE